MKLNFSLCIEVGEAFDISWCPKGGDDSAVGEGMGLDENKDGKLGLLAGVFMDGSVSIFSVPDPEVIRKDRSIPEDQTFSSTLEFLTLFDARFLTIPCSPPLVRAEPILRLVVNSTNCLAFDWGSHEMIAAGCEDGAVSFAAFDGAAS